MSMNVVDVGTPPDGWATTLVRLHGFANLPATREDYTESPRFSCFGRQWCLQICPGGDEDSPEGYVAVFLVNKSDAGIEIQFNYCVRDRNGKEVVKTKSFTEEFGIDGSGDNAWYTADFAKRSKLMTLLVNGSLIIEVRMKSSSTDKSAIQFIPSNPINKNVLELFMDEETADVVFEVGGEQQKGKRKKAKTSTTNFHAHRPILKKCAPLYEMCGKSDESGDITTVSITDVKPDIFKHMIYYTYGGKLSEEELKDNAKDIINACDKYGVVHLKLEAEAYYVKSNEITMDNMMDNLLYADSKNLALLKEAVMDYIVANKKRIIGKISFSNVPGDMMTDLLTAMSRGEDTDDDSSDDEDKESIKYNKMRVGTLRKMLDEKGLDVDGSRETMVAILKENDDDDDDDEDNAEDDNNEPVDA